MHKEESFARYSLRWLLCLLSVFLISDRLIAQESSVRPGINDEFRDPDIEKWIGRFEIESRETFEKRNEIVKALDVKQSMVIADVGAGTGFFARLFSSRVGKDGLVIAQDISQRFLDHIMRTAADQNLKNIRPTLGLDTDANLPDGSVDLVFLCDVYHHFEFPEKMMASIRTALRPGARVAIIDFIKEEGKSTEWVLNHVRAEQSVVEKEVESVGFKKIAEHKGILKDNYFIVFEVQ
jgi:ubiquinone/menaquinone biosynthesis C-methylase UbiE